MSTATATASTSKRGRFFYELITVKVEDKSYQIRKDRLERTSQYFQRIFSSLKDGGTNEGSKENPLELRGCTKAEFETLLSFLTSQTALSGPPEFDKEQWIAILKLGTLWSMHLVRTKALAHLESSGLDSKEKATIGMQYGVSQFFIEGSTDLAKGGFEASDIDNLGDSMGYATLARLLLVRSMARETNVALPLDKLKCLQCSATLVSKQSNSTVQDASPRLGSMSRAEPSHSSPLYGIGESGTASPWSSYARYQPPVPQSTAQQYQYDPQGAHYSASQASTSPQPLYGSGTPSSVPQSTSWASSTSIQTPKSSITLTLSCPTAACRGVPSANSVSVDAIELRVRIDVEDTIRQVFAEEVGGMS